MEHDDYTPEEIEASLQQLKERMRKDPVRGSQFFAFANETLFAGDEGYLCEFPTPGCVSRASWKREPSEHHRRPMFACRVCVMHISED